MTYENKFKLQGMGMGLGIGLSLAGVTVLMKDKENDVASILLYIGGAIAIVSALIPVEKQEFTQK